MVMEDPPVQIDIRALDGLLGVEIVGLEFDAGCDVVWEFGGGGDGFREILDDEFKVFEALCELNADEAVGAADVDDCTTHGIEGCPIVVVEQIAELITFATREGLHCLLC